MADVPDFPYDKVRARCDDPFHPARSPAQADLFALEWEGRAAVLKDFSARPWLIRQTWGRAIAGREVRVLRRLAGLEGVPELIGTAGPFAFLMQRLDAVRLPGRRLPPPPPEFWSNARRLLEEFHARGTTHGDLRRKNILVGPGGSAWLIDFATAIRRREGTPAAGLFDFFFKRARRIDRITYARIKASYAPELLDAEERRWLAEEPLDLRVGRWLKKNVYRLRKGRFWRRQIRRMRR